MLSERALSVMTVAKHQRDAEEFLRRWPRIRSIHQARDYLRQLGLHVGYHPPGVNPSDTIALLRSAVKSGRVTVVIERERATVSFRGDGGVPQPTHLRASIDRSRKSIAAMVANGTRRPATMGNADSTFTAHSWRQRYDDVSADDLIKYIKSVIAGISADTTNIAETADHGTERSTPLGNAESLSLGAAPASDSLTSIAARGVSEAEEAECLAQYERDLEMCHALAGPMGGARGLALCTQRAFMNFQQCRGY